MKMAQKRNELKPSIGKQAELEKERAQLEMKAREEKEKTKEMEEEKRRLQIAREEKRKKLREEAASEKAKKGGHDSHDGEESDEGGAGTASEAVAELDEHGNFTGDLELLMHRSGSRAAKKNALQQIKKDAGGGGQQSKGKGKGAGGTRGKDVVADKDENELSRDKDEDEDGDVGQRSRRRRRNEDEAEEKEKPGKGMGKGKGKEEERKKGGDRGGSNKKGIGKDDEDAEEDLEEEEGEEEEDDEDDSPCLVCGGMGDPTKALLCDSCDSCYHMYCLTPPLKRAPKGDVSLMQSSFEEIGLESGRLCFDIHHFNLSLLCEFGYLVLSERAPHNNRTVPYYVIVILSSNGPIRLSTTFILSPLHQLKVALSRVYAEAILFKSISIITRTGGSGSGSTRD